MVKNNRWPITPPTPKLHSPVHITGFIDCIDKFSLIPVIMVEELTLEIGNNRVTELINQARLESVGLKDPVSHQPFHTHLNYNFSWKHQPSTASLSSIPSYRTVRGRSKISARKNSVWNYLSRQPPSGSNSVWDSPSAHSSTPVAGEWEVWLETVGAGWRVYVHIVIAHE
ncbi:hypothetical protein M422DRAFT_265275 [Sphaerobolus stellatus SS14]|uniref:Uncharacterized protein n=1 Tax=Sphaerobolus stellatus (strain SS14) TaxID=990650 RepID=A0A0C9UDZ6_SPHS4|nr:hypothetical protein M422DRAFT_265275 [Sphaerobolus stellatus SS14]